MPLRQSGHRRASVAKLTARPASIEPQISFLAD